MFAYFSSSRKPVENRSTLRKQVKDAMGPLDAEGEKFVDESCIERYLRAHKDNSQKAANMLSETLKWRKESGVGHFTVDQFPRDADSGKCYIGGKTKNGVPVVINRKKAVPITLDEAEDYVNFLVLTLDTTIKMMPSGVEKWIWILDLNGYSRANSPPVSVTLRVIKMLASHYPERMEKCFIVDAPRIFSILYAAVYPLLDPVTKSKVIFTNSKDYDSKGKRADGQPDTSGFGESIHLFRAKFDFEKFKAMF